MSDGDVLQPQDHHLEVARTARFWTWGPAESESTWFVLHGYRQLSGRFIRRFGVLVERGVRVVAPEALSRFYLDEDGGPHGPEARVGATWMTREDREAEIADYIRYLDRLRERVTGPQGGGRFTILGFSQGAHTAARWFSAAEAPVHRLVLWGAGLPNDLDLDVARERWSAADIVLVRGETDRAYGEPSQARDQERLRSAGIAASALAHRGGHRMDDAVLRTLR